MGEVDETSLLGLQKEFGWERDYSEGACGGLATSDRNAIEKIYR